MITPLATAWVEVSRLLRVKTLVRVVKISTPSTVPTMVAAAAAEQRAADDHRGDGVELVELAVRRGAGGRAGHDHHGGEAAGQADQDVEVHRLALHLDAGEPGGLGVAADREGAAAEGGAVEQDPADDRDEREDDDEHRDPEDAAAEEVDERRGS